MSKDVRAPHPKAPRYLTQCARKAAARRRRCTNAGPAATAAERAPERRAERMSPGKSPTGSRGRRSRATADDVRPHWTQGARPGPSGRRTQCIRHARRPRPGTSPHHLLWVGVAQKSQQAPHQVLPSRRLRPPPRRSWWAGTHRTRGESAKRRAHMPPSGLSTNNWRPARVLETY